MKWTWHAATDDLASPQGGQQPVPVTQHLDQDVRVCRLKTRTECLENRGREPPGQALVGQLDRSVGALRPL